MATGPYSPAARNLLHAPGYVHSSKQNPQRQQIRNPLTDQSFADMQRSHCCPVFPFQYFASLYCSGSSVSPNPRKSTAAEFFRY
jgi:hypothetical protein